MTAGVRVLRRILKIVKFKRISTNDFVRSFGRLIPELASHLEKLTRSYQMGDSIIDFVRMAMLGAFIERIHSSSLLVEFAMAFGDQRVHCVPYHSGAIHHVEMPSNTQLLLGRPGILARRTGAVFANEISELESLMNKAKVRESEIQKFLESHPNFLRGLGYRNIYPQLVLERDDGTTLIPDFILEPSDNEWCDILDVKLPRQGIVVGQRDRAHLAAGIHEVAAQLREYASYFEQDKYRRWFNSITDCSSIAPA